MYTGLKLVGAAYLVWLGIGMLRADQAGLASADDPTVHSTKRVFRDSAMVEILNPKTALFYLAFLPQFTDSAAGSPIWLQLLVLGTVVNLMFSSADVLCVVMAARVQAFMKRSATANIWMQRLGGSILIGLGVKLAASQK